MEISRRKQIEYELQHFNFSSDEIIAENNRMMQSLLHKSISVFTEQLIKKQRIPDPAAERLRASCNKIALGITTKCKPAMKNINALFRQTFSIPKNVLLPTDLLQKHGYTEEYVESLREDARTAKDAVRQGAGFLASLDAEVQVHKALQPCYEAEEAVVKMLNDYQDEDIFPDDVYDLFEDLEDAGIFTGPK